MVRFHLDYLVVWSPSYGIDIVSPEGIERMTTLVLSLRSLSDGDRLETVYTLERSKESCDIIEVHQWMKGTDKAYINKVLKLNVQDRTRNNGFKQDKPRYK